MRGAWLQLIYGLVAQLWIGRAVQIVIVGAEGGPVEHAEHREEVATKPARHDLGWSAVGPVRKDLYFVDGYRLNEECGEQLTERVVPSPASGLFRL